LTWSSLPQRTGAVAPGGGPPVCLAITAKKSERPPSGTQLAIPIRPPGLTTRSSSSAVRCWSGANIAPKIDIATSKLASSNGSSCASPSTNSMSRRSAAARPREQRGDEIAADRVAPGPPRRGDRPVTAAGGDVQDPFVGQDLERFGE